VRALTGSPPMRAIKTLRCSDLVHSSTPEGTPTHMGSEPRSANCLFVAQRHRGDVGNIDGFDGAAELAADVLLFCREQTESPSESEAGRAKRTDGGVAVMDRECRARPDRRGGERADVESNRYRA